MKKLLPLSILLIISLLPGCIKENCGCNDEKVPPVLFQYEYVNYAWGYRHMGFLIDGQGHVKGFRQPKDWVFADSMGFISQTDLEKNLASCDTLYPSVDKLELTANYNRINEISTGNIKDNGMVMADAGTGVLSSWKWNEKAGKYESVFLISNGDMYKVNEHPDVKALVEWLKKAGEKTDRFYWFGM